MIRFRFQLDPYDKNTLFLFCGKKTNRIKGLLWEGDGFLLLYKRLDNGAFSWPRSAEKSQRSDNDDYRNGYKRKQVNSRYGSMEIEVPQLSLIHI